MFLKKIAEILRGVEGSVDVAVDQVSGAPQLQIRIDREAIARYGINVADVQEVVRAAVGGESAGQIYEGIRRYDIVVRYREDARATAEAISDILIATPDGFRVPLDQLAAQLRGVGVTGLEDFVNLGDIE